MLKKLTDNYQELRENYSGVQKEIKNYELEP